MEACANPPSESIPAAPGPEYVLAEDVLLVPIEDGTARLLDLCGDIYALPTTGLVMLQAVLEKGKEAAIRAVSQQFNADPAQVRADLEELLRGFEQKGIVHRPGAPPKKRRVRAFVASLLMTMVIPIVRSRIFSLQFRAWVLLAVARLSFAACRWTPTLEAWDRFWRKGPAAPQANHRAIAQQIDEAVRGAAARHWFRVECKERSLCCWALARSMGLPSELIIGVQPFPFAGHCWCEAGPLTLSDDRTRIDFFKPVVRYS